MSADLQETRKETRQRQITRNWREWTFKMLDFFTIFSKGGILLFCFKGFDLDKKAWESFVHTVNSLNKTVFLQVRILPWWIVVRIPYYFTAWKMKEALLFSLISQKLKSWFDRNSTFYKIIKSGPSSRPGEWVRVLIFWTKKYRKIINCRIHVKSRCHVLGWLT